VIARTSTMQYKATTKSIATIGEELGVHYILEGSVRQAGQRVRVTAQLIQVSDQAHVWAETFEREFSDLFSVQAEIGAHVADSLELEILPQAFAATERHAQLSPDVLAAYLRGRYYWQRRWLDFPANLHRALDHFQRVVSAAPGYADGHAALGQAYGFLSLGDAFREGGITRKGKNRTRQGTRAGSQSRLRAFRAGIRVPPGVELDRRGAVIPRGAPPGSEPCGQPSNSRDASGLYRSPRGG
jgi:hypothetical protein